MTAQKCHSGQTAARTVTISGGATINNGAIDSAAGSGYFSLDIGDSRPLEGLIRNTGQGQAAQYLKVTPALTRPSLGGPDQNLVFIAIFADPDAAGTALGSFSPWKAPAEQPVQFVEFRSVKVVVKRLNTSLSEPQLQSAISQAVADKTIVQTDLLRGSQADRPNLEAFMANATTFSTGLLMPASHTALVLPDTCLNVM